MWGVKKIVIRRYEEGQTQWRELYRYVYLHRWEYIRRSTSIRTYTRMYKKRSYLNENMHDSISTISIVRKRENKISESRGI